MKLRLAAGTLLALALPAGLASEPAHSAEAIKPGRWEFTSQMQAPAMPQLPPGVSLPAGVQARPGSGVAATHTTCIDPENSVPTDPRRECKIERMQRNGATVNWSTTCTMPQGAVRSDGVAHYAGDTMEATLTTHVPQGDGKTLQTSQHITGHYLGPCTGK